MGDYEVFFSRFAYEDLEEIYKYTKEKTCDVKKANQLYERIISESSKLGYFPKKHPIVQLKNMRNSNIRMFIIENYMLFYTINEEDKKVRIDKIFHSGIDWMSKF
ncbi:MAG: type II toxin-antitoxin system RelE/ParE family toxin [Clostridia bacterium]|nr:type II toxin-antitoxin system RelE/ParE family toxin [Clostridia bacterium]